MDLNSSVNMVSFKGRREDLKNIKGLTENNMPILSNKKKLILSAIDSVAEKADERDIKMLMGTVETMKYGIHNNSEFAKALGGTNGEKENTDWDGILKDTVRNAIDSSDIKDKTSLEAQFQKVFNEERPLTKEESTMLELRNQILDSKEMKNVLGDSDKTYEATRISQNLNYFLASSEINNEDKIKCLKLMNHFMSDDYEINPQLKDYKVQAFSEMLGDLIIKRPDEDALTIKDANQKQTGMCAAISIARKTITYEDKVRAMEIMMAELDNKPTMEVYDRTQLAAGKKIDIEKVHVDFTDGIKKGYRIVDIGAHQWMNAANTVGNGSISTAHYQAFDPDNYEIFRDAKWMNDLSPELKPAQTWLRYLAKEQGAIKSAAEKNENIAKVQKEVGDFKQEYEKVYADSKGAIRNILSKADSSASDAVTANVTRQILKADKLENKEFKVLDGDSAEVKSKKLSALIKSEMPNVSDSYLSENMENILNLRDAANEASKSLTKLKEHSNPKAIFSHNKNLFKAAAHHRRSVEAELEMPENLSVYEKSLNVPERGVLIQDSAKNILANLNSQSVVNNTAEKFGVAADKAAVKKAVDKAVRTSEVEIPAKLDKILGQLGLGDRVTVINNFIDDAQASIKSGNTEAVQIFAENAHVKPEAAVVLKKLESVKASLKDNPSNKQIADAANILGYSNQIEMTADMFKTVAGAVDSGALNKEQAQALFGDNADKKISTIGKNIKKLSDKQAQIERQLGLPSRKDVILNLLEKTGEIVPEKTLNAMQDKFDKVAEVKSEADSRIVDPGAKKPKVPDSMYLFTKEEKQQYAQISQKLGSWKEYADQNAAIMNNYLEPHLNNLYAEEGRLAGYFWVPAEGESGLFDNQSIKVLEMITGKRYYNEPDIDKVVAHIKKGEGSGTSSTNVDHRRYSGHAQYVAEVSPIEVIDPVTKERVMKDVLWHDNTWGRAEDSVVWTDDYGVERTDYGSGYGGPDGYIFDKRLMTGTFVEDSKVTPGILDNGEKFNLWNNTRIQGVDPSANKDIDKVFTQIFDLGNADQKLEEFEKTVKEAKAPINMKAMDILDDEMTDFNNHIVDTITHGNLKTQEAVDNLADKDVKYILEKTALQMSSSLSQVREFIADINDEEALKQIKEKLPEIHREMMAAPFAKGEQAPKQVAALAQNDLINLFSDSFTDDNIPSNIKEVFADLTKIAPEKLDGSIDNLKTVMQANAKEVISKGIQDKAIAAKLSEDVSNLFGKVIDEKIAIKSLDDMKQYGDIAELITKYTDKKFDTSSDEDLLAAFKKLQSMSNSEFQKFIADATNEDLGIKEVTTLDVAKQVNAQKKVPLSLVEQNARFDVIINGGPADENAPEWAYRGMLRSLSPVNSYIDFEKNGKVMFEKYGARGAIPKAEILTKEEIVNKSVDFAAAVADSVTAISQINGSKSAAVAQLNADIKAFVNQDVAPSGRDKANSLVKTFVKALRKNPDSPETMKAGEEVINFVSQNHIAANTKELVKDFVNELQSSNPNEEKLAVLRKYITAGIKSSEVAEVEYQMMDNASKAIAAITREKMADYSLTADDGTKISLDSDEGISFIVDKLANPANDSTAVQIFFTQTGLSEKAVDVIANTGNLKEMPKFVANLGDDLAKLFGGIKTLNGSFDEFAADNNVSYSSYKDALKHFVQTMDKEYIQKSADDKQIYAAYREFLMKTANADFLNDLPKEEVLSTLKEVHSMGIESISQQAMESASQLDFLSEKLEGRVSAMHALKLPKNSAKEQQRAKYIADANTVQDALDEAIGKINDAMA